MERPALDLTMFIHVEASHMPEPTVSGLEQYLGLDLSLDLGLNGVKISNLSFFKPLIEVIP
jgi:hypothetical protein